MLTHKSIFLIALAVAMLASFILAASAMANWWGGFWGLFFIPFAG